jgi:hypothetical protein
MGVAPTSIFELRERLQEYNFNTREQGRSVGPDQAHTTASFLPTALTALISSLNAPSCLTVCARLQGDPRADAQGLAPNILTRLDVDEVAAGSRGELVAGEVEEAD